MIDHGPYLEHVKKWANQEEVSPSNSVVQRMHG